MKNKEHIGEKLEKEEEIKVEEKSEQKKEKEEIKEEVVDPQNKEKNEKVQQIEESNKMKLGLEHQFFIDEINAIKKGNIDICEKINQKKDYSNQENLAIVEKIISRDNTDPIVIQTYLKILNKLNNENLLQNIIKYEFFLSKEWISKEFNNTYKKELSSSDLFYRLFDHITTFSTDMNPIEKFNFYRGIGNIGPDLNLKDVIKGFADYSTNKELSIFIIVQNIKKRILNHIDEIEIKKNNYKDNISISFDKKMLEEAEIFKKVIDFDKNLSKEKPTPEEREIFNKRKAVLSIKNIDNIDKIIERFKKTIKMKEKLETESFSTYFNNLSTFLLSVKKNLLIDLMIWKILVLLILNYSWIFVFLLSIIILMK